MSDVSFSGFPEDIFCFLEELSENNNREWFNKNKERYQKSVVFPVTAFISAIGKRLDNISPYFLADSRPHGGSMFRIYRDIRFSRDKRPYKESIGCQFRHIDGRTAHAPGFYLHIQPDNVFIGAGIWSPPNPVLGKIRTAIAEDPEYWRKVIRNRALLARFGRIRGEQLKRPPRGFDAGHLFIEDLKRKTFFLKYPVNPSLLMTPDFIDETEKTFRDASPLMAFITKAAGLSF